MKIVEIDRSKTLQQQPNTGHNRWHPDIPPLVEADPGEEVVLIVQRLEGRAFELTDRVLAQVVVQHDRPMEHGGDGLRGRTATQQWARINSIERIEVGA